MGVWKTHKGKRVEGNGKHLAENAFKMAKLSDYQTYANKGLEGIEDVRSVLTEMECPPNHNAVRAGKGCVQKMAA